MLGEFQAIVEGQGGDPDLDGFYQADDRRADGLAGLVGGLRQQAVVGLALDRGRALGDATAVRDAA